MQLFPSTSLRLFSIFFLVHFCYQCGAQDFEWVGQYGGASADASRSVATDGFGNAYTVGHIEGTADLDPGVGVATFTVNTGYNAFINKVDSAGDLVWARQIETVSSGGSEAAEIAVDHAGNAYVTGYFGGTVNFDPGTSAHILTASGSTDAFVMKFSPSGQIQWVKTVSGPHSQSAHTVTMDNYGAIYVGGLYRGSTDFDPGPDTLIFNDTIAARGAFILKLDTNGNLKWAAPFEGGNQTVDIACDLQGNPHATGLFETPTDFDPGTGVQLENPIDNWTGFVVKLDSSGAYQWVRSIKLENSDQSHLTVDGIGNVYVCGYYEDTLDLDPGSGSWVFTSPFVKDIYLMKLDPNGNILDAVAWGLDYGFCLEIVQTLSGDLLLAGLFGFTSDLDPSTDSNIVTPPTANPNDFSYFIINMDTDLQFNWAKTAGWEGSGCRLSPEGIAVNNQGHTYLTGNFNAECEFDFTPGVTALSSTSRDCFLLKIGTCSPSIVSVDQENDSLVCSNSGKAYQWIDCETGLAIPGETGKKLGFSSGGQYAVVVTQHNDCIDTSECVQAVPQSISERTISGITVFPNPAHDVLTIQGETMIEEVIIYDLSGAEVLRSPSASLRAEIPIDRLTSGLFSVTIRTQDTSTSVRIAVVK